jgi:Peptidase family M23
MARSKREYCVVMILLSLFSTLGFAEMDVFTPVVASPLTAGVQQFPGTDGKQHVVYELVLTNANATPARLQKIEVLDAEKPARVIRSFESNDLQTHLRTTGSSAVENTDIEFNGTRIFLVDVAMDTGTVPNRLLHRLTVTGGSTPARTSGPPIEMTYTSAPLDLQVKLMTIGPPLTGKGWVAANGCCMPGVHRATSMPVNGQIHFSQRFAIDWMRMDEASHMVNGNPADVHSYPGYGAEVIAVADGKVVSAMNTLDDQVPGTLPDPNTITLENVNGNHVVMDLGQGAYAFYAHLQKGSVRVVPGDQVKRGQVLGKLGNTGNTSAPHLHFHLMNGPSVMGSSGIPYRIDSFTWMGEIPEELFAKSTGGEGDFSKAFAPTPSPRKGQFPLDLTIVDFGGVVSPDARRGLFGQILP